jgi:hypothetical protein
LQNRTLRFEQAVLPAWPRSSTGRVGSPGAAVAASKFPPTRRPYLVFVRAGAESQHQRLLRENPDRNWDCCVNWYIEPPAEDLADYYWPGGQTLNKLDGFLDFRAQMPARWPYRYVLLLDDDVYLRPDDLSHFFRLCNYYGTYLSQPAQRWLTHTTLNSLVRNPVCVLRRVSFVEGMAPCFSAAALDELLHTFEWTKSVWGTDWAWAALLQHRPQVHVVDAVAMDHTRTGGGRPTLFYRKLRALGVDPGEDLRRMQRLFQDFRGPRTLTHGHVFRSRVPRRMAAGLLLLFERLKVIVRVRKQVLRTLRIWKARLQDRFWAQSVQ